MAAGDIQLTIIGNLTAPPELRFTNSGAAVANFTVVSSPRIFDKQANEWKDGEPVFMRCNIWRQAAENITESLDKGNRVIVTGRLKQRSFETREGEKRSVMELEVDEIGPSLKFATAKIQKATRSGSDAASSTGWTDSQGAPANDPWGSDPPPPAGSGFTSEPPF